MPNINLFEKDMSTYADQQYVSISYNRNTNSLPAPEGEITITENGEYNVTKYATAKVNIQGKEFKASVDILPEYAAIFAFTPTATVEITE